MKDPQKEIECPGCGEDLPVFRPYAICAYLEDNGWKKGAGDGHGYWSFYSKGVEGTSDLQTLEVPLRFDARDYPRCYWRLLGNLRTLEGRRLAVITKDIADAENRLLDRNPMAGMETPIGNYTKMEWATLMKEINEPEK